MKKLQILLIASFLLIILFSQPGCKSFTSQIKGDVAIIVTKDGLDPHDSLALHKNRDVEVFLLKNNDTTGFIWKGNIYSIHYYQNEKDTLRSHKAWIISKENFDKASFAWLSDTSVSVRLFSKVSGKESIHKLFGFGSSSGMFGNDPEKKPSN